MKPTKTEPLAAIGEAEKKLEPIAEMIRDRAKAAVENIIGVGALLIDAQQVLARKGSGTFTAWVETKCGMNIQTARRFMHVHKAFGDCNKLLHSRFDPSALYLLSAPHTPQEARQAAVRVAECGEHVTLKRARQIKSGAAFADSIRRSVEPEQADSFWDLDEATAKWEAGIEKMMRKLRTNKDRTIMLKRIVAAVDILRQEYAEDEPEPAEERPEFIDVSTANERWVIGMEKLLKLLPSPKERKSLLVRLASEIQMMRQSYEVDGGAA